MIARVTLIALLVAPSAALAEGHYGSFCLRSTDSSGGQVCFPFREPQAAPDPAAQASLRAELQRRAAEAIERLKGQQKTGPAP
jgi:hypothetical protein